MFCALDTDNVVNCWGIKIKSISLQHLIQKNVIMSKNKLWFKYGPTVKLLLLTEGLVMLVFIVGIILYMLICGLTHAGSEFDECLDNMPSIVDIALQDLGMIWAIYIAWKHKVIRMPETFRFPAIQRQTMWIPLLAGVLFFLGDTCIESLCGIQMPEDVAQTFIELLHSPLGFMSVCLFGPLIEELIMREGVMGSMLRRGVSPWTAIILSSVLFGAMHMNLSQFIFATIGGIALGILYYKSGNIILPLIVHALNNTFSSILTLTVESDDLIQLLGGQTIVYILLVLTWSLSASLFVRYWRTAPR